MCVPTFIKRTKNGMIVHCLCSDTYQLLFKNINYNLTYAELENFAQYIGAIDEEYWQQEYKNSVYEKKIPIPSLQSNLMILLDSVDLYELRELLNYKTKATRFMTFREIDHTIMLN